MFKIVQTSEKGKPQLCIVPEAWEKDDTLYWPKRKADKLVIHANSKPKENWFQMPCIRKRARLKTLEDAKNEMAKILLSEDDESEPAIAPLSKSNNTAKSSVQVSSSSNQENSNATQTVSQRVYQTSQENSTQFDILLNSTPTPAPLQIQDLPFAVPFENHSEKYERILKNQEAILKNQTVILNQLANFSVMFEKLMERYDDKKENYQNIEQPASRELNPILKDFKPIDSIKDMDLLEAKLKNEATEETLASSLSLICGKSGKEHGLNACYTLVDNLFTRNFMTLCSWAGGSRGEKEKIPFKLYRNVINLFFKLVHQADKDFTMKNCEQFFKTVLKNSTRRNEPKQFRISSRSKKRPKNLTYKTKSDKDKLMESIDLNEIYLTDYEQSIGSDDSLAD